MSTIYDAPELTIGRVPKVDSYYSTVVLVTGAHQGIGFEIAKRLGVEQKDYHIILASKNEQAVADAEEMLRGIGCSVEALVLDITSDLSVAKAVTAVEEKYGRLDVLINNATFSECRFAEPHRRNTFRAVFETNVFGVAVVTDAFLPLLERSHITKRLIFLTSVLGSHTLKASRGTAEHIQDLRVDSSSHSALNMLATHYAVLFENDPSWKINMCCADAICTGIPGSTTVNDVTVSVANACRLAMLGPEGESGTYSNGFGQLPW